MINDDKAFWSNIALEVHLYDLFRVVVRVSRGESKGIIVLQAQCFLHVLCFLVDCLNFLYRLGSWLHIFEGILVAHRHFVEQFVHQVFAPVHALFIGCFGCLHELFSLFLIDRWNIVTNRDKRSCLRLKLFLVLLNDFFLSDGHFWFLNLDQSMLMLKNFLTSTTKIKVITKDTLIPDPQDPKLITTVRTHDLMDKQLSMVHLFEFIFQLVGVFEYFCSFYMLVVLISCLFFSGRTYLIWRNDFWYHIFIVWKL